MHDWSFMSDHLGWMGPEHGLIALGFWVLVVGAIVAMAVYIVRVTRKPPPKDR